MILLYQSPWPVWLTAAMMLSVLWNFWRIYSYPVVQDKVQQLSYHTTHWCIHTHDGKTLRFEQAQIRVDCGFVMLLCLHREHDLKLNTVSTSVVPNTSRWPLGAIHVVHLLRMRLLNIAHQAQQLLFVFQHPWQQRSKSLVIFHDQLTPEQIRGLYLIQRIQSKKNTI